MIFAIMAGVLVSEKVKINHTIVKTLIGDAEFSKSLMDYDDMYVYMGVKFKDNNDPDNPKWKHYPGKADVIALYNQRSAAEKAIILDWEKDKVVNCFNDAMETSYTKDQVPSSLFTRN